MKSWTKFFEHNDMLLLVETPTLIIIESEENTSKYQGI